MLLAYWKFLEMSGLHAAEKIEAEQASDDHSEQTHTVDIGNVGCLWLN